MQYLTEYIAKVAKPKFNIPQLSSLNLINFGQIIEDVQLELHFQITAQFQTGCSGWLNFYLCRILSDISNEALNNGTTNLASLELLV